MIRAVRLLALAGALASLGQSASALSAEVRFPAPFVGRWGSSVGGCSAGAVHGGLTIAPATVRDGEFAGRLRSVSRRSSTSLQAVETWDAAEDGPARIANLYRLSSDGRRLTIKELTRNGVAATVAVEHYERCGRHVG